MSAATTDRAVCLTCELRLPTEDDVRKHADETINAAKAEGRALRSHQWRILTRTAEEIVRDCIRDEVDAALYDLFDRLDELIEDEELTEEQVSKVLAGVSVEDAWNDHLEDER